VTTSCAGAGAIFVLDVVLLPSQANASVIAWMQTASEEASSLLRGFVHHSRVHVIGCGRMLS